MEMSRWRSRGNGSRKRPALSAWRLLLAFCLASTAPAVPDLSAQGPRSGYWLTCRSEDDCKDLVDTTGAAGFPTNSPWFVKTELALRLDGTGTFEDDFLASGQLVVDEVALARNSGLRLPILANFSTLSVGETGLPLQEQVGNLLSANRGLSLALQPYYATANPGLQATVFGTAGWKMNAKRDLADTSLTRYLHQGRFSVGLALDAFLVTGPRPISLSAEAIYRRFSDTRYQQLFGEDRDSFTSLELTGIVPLGQLGFLAQGLFTDGAPTVWRVALVLAGKMKEAETGGGSPRPDAKEGGDPAPKTGADTTGAKPPGTPTDTPPSGAEVDTTQP